MSDKGTDLYSADLGVIVSTTFKSQLYMHCACSCGWPSGLQPAGLVLTVSNKHNNVISAAFQSAVDSVYSS